ncbi:MAG: glycosyltransferase [Acidobacteria bacterium]|nr:glycosyltransferase [Acidobacteriota bacterium]
MSLWRSATQSGASSERIRLFKFLAFFAIGGTERQVVNLVKHLDYSKFELHFGCFRRDGQFLSEVEKLRVPITEYDVHSLYNHHSLWCRLRLAKLLRQRRVHIVHTYGFYSSVFAVPAARLAGIPLVVCSIRDTGELLTPLQKRVQIAACRMADSVLVNADAVRQWLMNQGIKDQKIKVIHNGIDLSGFEQMRGGDAVRQQLGIPANAPVVAMFSRLNRMKGIEYFLEAAAAVSAAMPEARFLIVGDTRQADRAYAEQLQARAIELGLRDKLIFTGFRLDVPHLLSQVTLSVLPSLSEGLSNSLLESMAAGVPVIATRVGGNPEIVKDGVTGMLVPPQDAAALAAGMRTLLEDQQLARRFGEAGRQRILHDFSLDRMVRKTEQHYEMLIEGIAQKHARHVREAA